MIEINLYELKKYVEIAFDGDTELEQYHISNSNYAEHTYNEICKTSEILKLKYYKIGEYGFTVIAPNLLYSFGINKQFRNKKTLENWFVQVKDILGTFDCALHGKNSRAINHLLKQGMKIKEQIIVLQCL